MFETYDKTVIINDTSYVLKPLTGKMLPLFWSVVTKLEKGSNKEDFDFSVLDESTITKLHTVCLETFKKSYPSEDEDKLDSFVSQNFIKIFPVIIELNMNSKE